MKNRIVSEIVSIEKCCMGKLPWKGILFNSDIYYAPFISLYRENPKAFADAIVLLRYAVPLDEGLWSDLSYFSKERISVHALRLSLYFKIDPYSVPVHLRALLLASLKMSRTENRTTHATGRRLYNACISFLRSVTVESTPNEKQLFLRIRQSCCPRLKKFSL